LWDPGSGPCRRRLQRLCKHGAAPVAVNGGRACEAGHSG
jgi:hypothetical protein